MAMDRDKFVLFGSAGALRLLLFITFPSLPPLLAHRVEISTPITSFKRLQEGLFLYIHNVSPYDGGVYHQAPLLLPIFSLLPDYRSSPVWTHLIYIFTDLLSAYALVQICETGESVSSRLFTSSRRQLRWSSTAVAAAFLYSPFTIATCLAQPTSVFTNCAILQAMAAAASGSIVNSVLALSLASYLSMYPVLLAPPLALLAYDRMTRTASAPPSGLHFFAAYPAGLAAAMGALFYMSYLIMDSSWEFIGSTYGVQLSLSDLTPNVGLWWYFFIEMFDSFREFFLGVFWLHMASYSCGLTIRLRTQPLFVLITLLGIFTIFKPYPSISDSALYFSLLPLYRHVFPLLRYPFIATAALLHATFLGPAFYHLWIYAGSGNANFFYAITLVWSLGLTIVVTDSIYAVLRDEFEVERPEVRGKELKRV